MRRKRRGLGSDVLIDVTSLLDVIFIILLVVLLGQSNVETNLKQAQAEAETARTQTEAEQRLYEQQLELAENMCLQFRWWCRTTGRMLPKGPFRC